MRQIILGLFLIVSTTLFSQDFSFRTKYLTESIALGQANVSLADVRVTYEKNILKIYDLTLKKNVIEKEVVFDRENPKRITSWNDDFFIVVERQKRKIKIINVKDFQETYTFSLHKQ